MLVEIRQTGSEQLLDRVELDEPPSPGRWFLHDDGTAASEAHRRRTASAAQPWPSSSAPAHAPRR